jgi:hypothetical protein
MRGLTNVLGILTAALQLGCIVRSGELIFLAKTASGVMNSKEELKVNQPGRSDLLVGMTYLWTVVGWLQHD